MTGGGTGTEAGWYPDHYQPSRLRYWDGEIWTDHYADPPGGGSGDGLPSIGEWLGNTFNAIGAYGIPAAGLAVGTGILINLLTWIGLDWAVGDGAIVDEEFVGDLGRTAVRGAVVIVGLLLAQGFVWLAVNRFMQRAHLQADPTIGDALRRALVRLPRLVGVMLVVAFGFIIVMAVFVLLIALVAGGLSGALGAVLAVLLTLLLIPAGVFVGIKLSFLSAAVVASPTSESVLRVSAGVSKGRFWGVFGRVILVSIGVFMVSSIASAALGGLGQPIDQSAIEDIIVVPDGDSDFENLIVRDFAFSDLLPSGGRLVASILVSSILNGLTGLVSTSAMMRLYLDSGAPSEVDG